MFTKKEISDSFGPCGRISQYRKNTYSFQRILAPNFTIGGFKHPDTGNIAITITRIAGERGLKNMLSASFEPGKSEIHLSVRGKKEEILPAIRDSMLIFNLSKLLNVSTDVIEVKNGEKFSCEINLQNPVAAEKVANLFNEIFDKTGKKKSNNIASHKAGEPKINLTLESEKFKYPEVMKNLSRASHRFHLVAKSGEEKGLKRS